MFDDFENNQYLAIFRLPENATVDNSKSRDCESAVNISQAPETLHVRGATHLKEPRPDVGVRRKTGVPCRTVPGAVVAWADDSRFSRRRVAVASERRSREGTKAVASVEGALGVARERAR